MSRVSRCVFIGLVLVLAAAGVAYAQATASISGVVKDPAGGVVPGVTVVVKDDATGRTSEASPTLTAGTTSRRCSPAPTPSPRR